MKQMKKKQNQQTNVNCIKKMCKNSQVKLGKYAEKYSGITLISLVITIIILIMLAGISISLVLGENGLFNKAKQAKEETEIATVEEQRQFAMAEAAMHFDGKEYKSTYHNEEVTIQIPTGFAVSQVEGENTVDDGLVITDSEGNEYVWVNIPKNVTENASNVTEIKNALVEYTKDYREENYDDIWYDGKGRPKSSSEDLNDSSGCGLTCEQYKQLYEKMLNSIKENNGFWVGRYETGINSYIKANNDVLTGRTIDQAQNLASNMYSGNLTSSLIFGIQYDLIMKFFEENIKGFSPEILNTSEGLKLGNYKNNLWSITNPKAKYYLNDKCNAPYTKKDSIAVLTTTGASEEWKQMNIYDLFGNLWEFTLESYNVGKTSYPVVVRGGSHWEDSEYVYIRNVTSTNYKLNDSPRVVMY